jgi:hypothetical protein
VVLSEIPCPLARTLMVWVPGLAVLPTTTDITLVVPLVSDAGLNVAVTPAGTPSAARLMVPV